MPLIKPSPTWGGKTWWKELRRSESLVLQQHRTGPPLWFGASYRILTIQNNFEVANAATLEAIQADWDLLSNLLNADIQLVGSRSISDAHLLDLLTGAWQKQEAAAAMPLPSSPKQSIAIDAHFQRALDLAKIAIEKGDRDALCKLLEQNEKLLQWSDDLGRTIAHLVCEVVSVQSPPLIKVLITRNADFAKKDNSGMTPLHWVCLARNLPAVELILESANPPLLAIDAKGNTPLHVLIRNFSPVDSDNAAYFHLIERMLRSGALVDAQTFEGETSLHIACLAGNVEMVKFLLKHGADVRLRTATQSTVLEFAAQSCNLEVMRLVLDSGAEVGQLLSQHLWQEAADLVTAYQKKRSEKERLQRQGELLARQTSALTSSFSSALWTPVDFAAKAAWSVVSSIGGRTEPADLIPFFKLPQDEVFVEEYGCMYHDEAASVPCQVRLYVFQHFLCFNTPTISLGLRAAKEVIPLKEVTLVKKYRSTLSTTIEVLGASRKYAFSAFYNAEEALNVISFLWQNREKSGPLFLGGRPLTEMLSYVKYPKENQEMHKLLGEELPPTETLVERFACGLHSTEQATPTGNAAEADGILFVSQNYLGYAQPSQNIVRVIPLRNVVFMEKQDAVMEVPNSILIVYELKGLPQRIYLSDFADLEAAHAMLTKQLDAFKGLLKESRTVLIYEASEDANMVVIQTLIEILLTPGPHGERPRHRVRVVVPVQPQAPERSRKYGDALSRLGAEVVWVGETISDTDRVAFLGIDQLFLVCGMAEDMVERATQLLDLVKNSHKLSLIVKVSVVECQTPSLLHERHRAIEQSIELTGVAFRFLRIGLMLQTFSYFSVIREQGRFWLPNIGASFPMIDARVLARVAATLLTADDSPVGGGILHIAAESLKATEVREVIAKVLNLNGPQRSNSASSANAKQIASTLGAAFGRPLPRSESNSALERDREEAKEREKPAPPPSPQRPHSGSVAALPASSSAKQLTVPTPADDDAGKAEKEKDKDKDKPVRIPSTSSPRSGKSLSTRKDSGGEKDKEGEKTPEGPSGRERAVTSSTRRMLELTEAADAATQQCLQRSLSPWAVKALWDYIAHLTPKDIKAPYYDLSPLERGGAVPRLKQWVEESVALFDQEGQQYFDPEEHLRLYELFKAMRSDNRDVLTKKDVATQLGVLMNEPGLVDALFSAFDVNKDGEVTQRKFVSVFSCMVRGTMEEKLELAFRLYDFDADGFISQEDFSRMVTAMRACLKRVQLDVYDVGSVLNELFAQLELAGGGRITREIFKQVCMRNSKLIQSLGVYQAAHDNTEGDSQQAAIRSFPIWIGHPKWPMVQQMLLGIRRAVGEAAALPSRALTAADYAACSEMTLPQEPNGEAWTFRDYAPMVFRALRELYGVNHKYYMYSLGPEKVLGNILLGNLSTFGEVATSARSGSFFLRSADGAYMVKTLPVVEEQNLRRLLTSYYEYVKANPNTLISRFFGLHSIRKGSGKEITFVVMGNVFHSELKVHEQYDLKGSSIDRLVTLDDEAELDQIALKDMNLHRRIYIGPRRKAIFLEQVERDACWLESHNICDYSLLAGFHFCHKVQRLPHFASSSSLPSPPTASALSASTHLDLRSDTSPRPTESRRARSSSTSGSEEPRRAFDPSFARSDSGGLRSCSGDEVYFLGIIDNLTTYNFRKKSEHTLKSIVHDSDKISAIPPHPYRLRFQRYLASIIE